MSTTLDKKTANFGMKLLSNMLKHFIKQGTLRVIDSDGIIHEFGGTPKEPVVTIRFSDPKLPMKLVMDPDLAAGEAYMDERLVFEDSTLADFMEMVAANKRGLGTYPMQKFLRSISMMFRKIQQSNPLGIEGAQKNVAHHYDLSDELYRLFLDEDLQYTCAYFENGDETLEEAQLKKKRHVAAKLKLEDGLKIVEFGCGWGGFSLYLASLYDDIEIEAVTLSTEQQQVAEARAKEAGVDDRVKFKLLDYREVEGRFDRVVSVGMMEHIGAHNYDELFKKAYDTMSDDGLGFFHTIGHMSPPGNTSSFLRKYIFPGGYTPAISEVTAATERQHLWVSDIEVWRMHYAETLKEWNARFQANRARIAEIYDERFCRMWEFYLISGESIFRTGPQMIIQMQIARTREAAGLTRDYIFETEKKLKALESKAGKKKAA